MKRRMILYVAMLFFSGSAWAAASCGTPVVAAGCFISTPEGVVLGINSYDEVQLLVGRSIMGETAKDTAKRETKEESGLDVSVGEFLWGFYKGRGRKKGWVCLFKCSIDPSVDPLEAKIQPEINREVKEIVIINPSTLEDQNGVKRNVWRFPTDIQLVRKLFSGDNK